MQYCHVCGAKLPDDAAFCPNCGTKVMDMSGKTATGAATSPSDEMREAFTRMSLEMEKAFNIAARELQGAFETARNNIQKNVYKAPIVCSNCGEKNSPSA
ncbi:MAG TPA: zinc-ribbon domain-containing protein, partial [Candidatus Nanoarchaeia archaeon]|nr:zinc-ribbon domain-containing protein [Candidatus Nanoarchaeia archaeon]